MLLHLSSEGGSGPTIGFIEIATEQNLSKPDDGVDEGVGPIGGLPIRTGGSHVKNWT
jgi:hypothetical protein